MISTSILRLFVNFIFENFKPILKELFSYMQTCNHFLLFLLNKIKKNHEKYFAPELLTKFFKAELLLILLRNLIFPFIEVERVVTGVVVSFISSKVNSKSSFFY